MENVAAVRARVRARIDAWEPGLGAVVRTIDCPGVRGTGPGYFPDPARGGALGGMAVGVKDLLAVAGLPRECGAPELVDGSPQSRHATAVERVVSAGGVLVATLAMHPLAYGITTPAVRNPRAAGRVAGGSSGGSAAALATGIADLAFGSDSGGSVRIPASCCGVVGLKTTRGAVPLTGVQPLAWSLDTVGPMARSVDDCGRMLEVIAGFDPADPYSTDAPLLQARAVRTVGVPLQVAESPIDDDVRALWERALSGLSEEGIKICDVDLPLLAGANKANGRILGAEATALYGALLDRMNGWDADVRQRVERGLRLTAPVVAQARHLGMRLRADLRSVFEQVDALVTPTLPCRVPRVGDEEVDVAGQRQRVVYAMTRLTNPWNLTGLPAGSVPAGEDRDGAPVGVQVVGPWLGERTVLSVMGLVERLAGGPWPIVDRVA